MNTAGATTLAGPIGGTTPLTSVTTDQPGTVTVGSVTTTGAQSYQENTVSLTGTYTTTNSAFTAGTAAAAVTLGGNTTITTGTGPIAFNGTINGAQSLTLNSTGTTTLAGAVGGTHAAQQSHDQCGRHHRGQWRQRHHHGQSNLWRCRHADSSHDVHDHGRRQRVSFGNNVTNTLAGASITVNTPALSLANGSTVATTGNGNISFIVDGLTPGPPASMRARAPSKSPVHATKTIEYGDVDTARVTDVYYGSTFTNIGRPASRSAGPPRRATSL